MKNSEFLKRFIAIFMTFIAVLSFSLPTFAGDGMEITSEEAKALRDQLTMAGPLEMTLSEMALGIGDFIMEYIVFLMKEEVTIQRIIYNRVSSLNANFFENASNPSNAPATEIIRTIVNNWYNILSKIVLMVYLAALVVVGLKTMLGTAGQKADAKELLIKWTMGLAIFFFFPYVMRYSFELNEAFIRAMANYYGGAPAGSVEKDMMGGSIGGVSELRSKEFELRSPEYMERSTYILTLGSEEATDAYVNQYEDYKEKGDMMRLMRALAGVTGRFIYVILWYMMLWQLLLFIYAYFKRYLIIAFLIAIFPITLLEYVIGTVSTGKQSAISMWSKEFFTNVFLQSIHAVVYVMISAVVMNQLMAQLQNGGISKINGFLMLVAINFVFVGEKMIRDIISAVTSTINNPEDDFKSAKGSVKEFGSKTKQLFSK